MKTPIVKELPLKLEPVTQDDFLGGRALAHTPRRCPSS
jgi:hypothetical protein